MNRIGLWLVAAFVILAALACGGGGGGGTAAGSFTYTTIWNAGSSGVTGIAQRVSLFDLDGRRVATQSFNQGATSTTTITLSTGSQGTYRLLVELYSDNALTFLTGTIETTLNIGGATVFESAVGDVPTTLSVTPDSVSFTVQQSKKLYALGRNVLGKGVFFAPSAVQWQSLSPGIANVNASGIVFGVSQGSANIRATHSGSGVFSGALAIIQPFTTTTGKWTVLIYMNAANDLDTFSVLNMNQLETVAQNNDVRFVVQWKQAQIPVISPNPTFVGTRRYLVKPDNSSSVVSELLQDMGPSVDMGQPQTLADFVNWGLTYYPANRTVLIIWNHGNGWRRGIGPEPTRAVSYDDDTGSAIQTWQLAQAIGSHTFDIVAFDASLMQMLEVALEIESRAKFVVGSEESPPGAGYPYQNVFNVFRDNPDASTATLSKAFVDAMVNEPSYVNSKITQSVLDTTKFTNLVAALDGFADELIANQASLGTLVPQVRTQAQSYSPTSGRVYRDLIHLATLIKNGTSIPSLQTAADNLITAANATVVWEGHNANSPGSKGISIDFSPASTFNTGSTALDYGLLRISQNSSWNEWLQIAP